MPTYHIDFIRDVQLRINKLQFKITKKKRQILTLESDLSLWEEKARNLLYKK